MKHMGKRQRLKRGLRRLLGQAEEAAPAQATPVPGPRVSVAKPEPAAPAPVAPVSAPPKPTQPAPEAVSDPEAEAMAAKVAKHFEKTRVAMLKFIVDQGGQSSMADMHDRSERRYFIAHKRFSDLMEGIVEEGLIEFDHATGVAKITEAGEAYIA